MKNNRIDTIYSIENLKTNVDNLLDIDIQDDEFLALKGNDDLLHYFEYAYLEVNRYYVYKDSSVINQIDEYLLKYNFKKVATNCTNEKAVNVLYIGI